MLLNNSVILNRFDQLIEVIDDNFLTTRIKLLLLFPQGLNQLLFIQITAPLPKMITQQLYCFLFVYFTNSGLFHLKMSLKFPLVLLMHFIMQLKLVKLLESLVGSLIENLKHPVMSLTPAHQFAFV